MSEITEIFTYPATALLLKLNDLLMGIYHLQKYIWVFIFVPGTYHLFVDNLTGNHLRRF